MQKCWGDMTLRDNFIDKTQVKSYWLEGFFTPHIFSLRMMMHGIARRVISSQKEEALVTMYDDDRFSFSKCDD